MYGVLPVQRGLLFADVHWDATAYKLKVCRVCPGVPAVGVLFISCGICLLIVAQAVTSIFI